MAAPGRFNRTVWGTDELLRTWQIAGSATGTAMATLNTGFCARFTALDTRDVASVYVNWSTVSSPGTVQVRIETIDATTGKPSGSLYDASASVNITPTAGWQIATFAVLPTAGLVAGTEYAVVLLTTVAGTTQSLRIYVTANSSGMYPSVALTAADGTTRANFAEVVATIPVMTLVMEDAVEEVFTFSPYATANSQNLFGTAAAGQKVVVPANATFSVAGIEISGVTRVGTPAGDLRFRVFSGNSAVSGTSVTVDKDSLTGASTRHARVLFPAPVSLAAGTYRVVLDSGSSANSSNCWRLVCPQARVSGNVPSGFTLTSTTDVTAGTITWTDDATSQAPVGLLLDDLTASGGGGYSRGRSVNA
jgi:hypothetical protein